MGTLTYLLVGCLAVASVPSPHTPITPAQPAAAAVTREPVEVRRARELRISGATLLLASCFGWGFMVAGLGTGERSLRAHDRIVASVNAEGRPPDAVEQNRAEFHEDLGRRTNRMAIVGAVIGAALTIVGAALLGRGLASTRTQGRFARRGARWRLRF